MFDSTKRYVAVDLGVTRGQVVLATVTSGSLTVETVHSFQIPTVRMAGQDYWDIYAAYGEVIKGLSLVGAKGLAVESIGIDAWGPGIVCLGRDGSFLGLPRICGSVLSEAVQAKFFKRMDRRELYEAAGSNVLDSHAALQLFGLRRAKSVSLEEAKSLLFIPEAMVCLLTGKRVTEFTSLSAAGLVDRRKGKLSKDVLEACKVRPKRFPSVVQPGSKPGKLTEEAAQATGLGRIHVVTVAGHDVASAAAALPAAGSSSVSLPSGQASAEGSAFLLAGDVCILGVQTAAPVVNDQTFEMNFSNEAGADGVNLLLKRILDDSAEGHSPGSRRLYSAGSGIDAATAQTDYSSLAEEIGNTFVKLQSVTPFRLRTVCVAGDRAADPAFCQLVADECTVPITVLTPAWDGSAGVAALGNILVQSGLTRQAVSSLLTPVTYNPSI